MHGDTFPAGAGGGALPIMAWDDQALRGPGMQNGTHPTAAAGAAPPPAGLGPPVARGLAAPQAITGVLQTVVEPHGDALLRGNAIEHQTIGDRQARGNNMRTTQPAMSSTPRDSVANALHPTLYHTGSGGWANTDAACDEKHFRKFRLASINPKFRRCHEVRSARHDAPCVRHEMITRPYYATLTIVHHRRERSFCGRSTRLR